MNPRTALAQEVAHSPLHSLADIVQAASPVGPVRSGVYFLIRDGAVVYVGQSRHVEARLASHMLNRSWRPFDSWAVMSCPVEELRDQEEAYIRALTPEYNQDARTRMVRQEARSIAMRVVPSLPDDLDFGFIEAAKRLPQHPAYMTFKERNDATRRAQQGMA